MIKYILSLLIILVVLFSSKAQTVGVAINNTGASPNTKAILDVDDSSNSKGILIPRLTTLQRTSIASLGATEEGLTVYDETTNSFWFWNGLVWVEIITGDRWKLAGNSGTTPGTDFIGTTDNKDLEFRTNNIKRMRISTKGQLEIFNTGYSVFIGDHAGEADDLSSNNNVFIGFYSGKATTTGSENVALGSYSLYNNTTGAKNIALGRKSMYTNTTGAYNIAIGSEALNKNTTGAYNIAIGRLTMERNTSGKYNTAAGYEALMNNTTANYNTANGYSALKTNTTGYENTALGSNSLYYNTTGDYNTATGSKALWKNTTANHNTANGSKALYNNTTGTENTASGSQALYYNSDGNKNSTYGAYSGYNITSGDENTFIGNNVGKYMQTGNSNTAIGYNAFFNFGGAGGTHAGGNGNVAVGKYAMFNPTSGDYNVALGYSAFSLPNTGAENVFIGYNSDRDDNTSLSNVTAVGAYSEVNADKTLALGSYANVIASEATAIGYKAYANNTNTLILGQINGVNGAVSDTKVGIGTTSPQTKLNLLGGFGIGSGQGLSTIHGDKNSIQINTDTYYGGTFDEHSGYLIFSTMATGWTNAKLNFCTSDNWGSYNTASPALVIKQTGIVVNGTTYASDRRVKTDIKEIEYGLETIIKLHPVSYNKHVIDGDFNNGDFTLGASFAEVGLIAQDVYEVVPEVVSKPEDETKELWGVDYAKLTPILIKAVQEQQKEIEELRAIVKELQEKSEE